MSKKKISDPHAEREAQKYDNPIPSREYIMDYLKVCGRLVSRDELMLALEITDAEQQEALRRRLRAMERDGQLVFVRRGGYGLVEKMNLLAGRIIGHKDGFGFMSPDDGSADLFLSAREMRKVFDRDRVLVRIAGVDRRGRREANIVEVLEHNTQQIVGRLFVEDGLMFVVPDNKRISQNILIPPGEASTAKHGQVVTAAIMTQPTGRSQAIARVIEILGDPMAPGMEAEIAVRSHNIPHEWPAAVLQEIAVLHEEVVEADKKDRIDLRALPLVTIDGEDAKDFDDAVYCEPKRGKKGWKLYVAIADVSHYVAQTTALDQEALNRGNSVYFPGSVIPMLPEILSNGLCSLKPKVDRLCMVCEMDIDKAGELKKYRFYPAVMHSQARLTYTEVTQLLEMPTKTANHSTLLPHLQSLHALYRVLRLNREARGAIDFETTETKIIFGENRKIEKIMPTVRTVAHRIIEECMLMANVAAARFLLKAKLPTLYRVHNGPALEKLLDLRAFLGELGLRLQGNKVPEPRDYANLLKAIQNRPDRHLIQTVLLRSLSQAVYSPDNAEGHFGLAFDAYTHFTSPIRRYPDLLVHRAIRFVLSKQKKKLFSYDSSGMTEIGMHCSMMERRADEATRDAVDWLKCEFMRERVGEEFDGIITSVVPFGLFVELKNIYIEGLVHITALKDDYYQFDSAKHRMHGERTGMVYALGDVLRIKVVRVDLDERRIDFDLTDTKQKKPLVKLSKKKSAKKRKKKQ